MSSRKVTFTNSKGQQLDGRLEEPNFGPRRYALFAHCFTCTKDIPAASRISRALSDRGFGVLRFDFTGLGNSDGEFENTDFSSNVEDLVSAADFLKRQLQAPELLIGHSLGGAAVLMAAQELPAVRGVVTIGAPSNPGHLESLLGNAVQTIEEQGAACVNIGSRPFRIKRKFLQDLRSQNLTGIVGRLRKPLLILHSPVDQVVSIDHARSLYEAAYHPKSFISLDSADHLLKRQEDSAYVADMVAAWAGRYVNDTAVTDQKSATPQEGSVRVVEEGSGLAQTIEAGKHLLRADEPEGAGGQDRGPTPYDLLLASLGSCTGMTLRMYAKRKGWKLDHIHVTLSHSKVHANDCDECEDAEGYVDVIERIIKLEGDLSMDQQQRLLEIADKCPVHRSLQSNIRIRTRPQNGKLSSSEAGSV